MTSTLAAPVHRPSSTRERSPAALVIGIVAVVLVVDQLVKAYAWRTLDDVHINSGGNPFSGSTVGALLEHPVWGAVLDVLDAALLAVAGHLLVRWCRSRVVAAAGALTLAGWVSNIGDRLGLHYVTAPGSVRGVVDYVPLNGHYWNLADLAIALGTAGFLLAGTGSIARSVAGPRRGPRRRPPLRVPAAAVGVVLLGVCALATVGSIRTGELDGPQSLAVGR